MKRTPAKKKPNFSQETREAVFNAQHGMCGCTDCYEPIDDFHHIKSNSITNNNSWPLFMQSPFNCVGVSRGCHDSEKIYQFKITSMMAQVYENFLQGLAEGPLYQKTKKILTEVTEDRNKLKKQLNGVEHLIDPDKWKMGTGQEES